MSFRLFDIERQDILQSLCYVESVIDTIKNYRLHSARRLNRLLHSPVLELWDGLSLQEASLCCTRTPEEPMRVCRRCLFLD